MPLPSATPPALPDAAQPLHARLRERLRADILEGRLKPHQQLPSESRLGAQYAVSRITVRQALASLLADGLIVTLHGKGSFVAAPGVSPRLVGLQGLAEALRDDGREVTTQVLVFHDAAAPAAVLRRLGLPPGAAATELLTLRSTDGEPLSLNRSWLPAALGARLRDADVARRDLLSIFETDLAITVGRAEVRISAAAAGKLERRHLALPKHAPVLEVERMVYAGDDSPLQLETSVYRADAFSYRLTLAR